MRRVGKILRLLLPGIAVFMLGSCSVSRYMPQGARLLTDNHVAVDRAAPRDERVARGDVTKFIRQTPNGRLLGMRISLAIYCIPAPEPRTALGRGIRKLGRAPVVFDSTDMVRSATSIKNYLDFRGFIDSHVGYSVDTSRRHKAAVTYTLLQNSPYRISSIKYDFQDPFIGPAVMADSARTLVAAGRVMDFSVLQQERDRVMNNLRRKGYYNFAAANIVFEVDTTLGGHKAELTMVIKKFQDGFDASGNPVLTSHPIYRISAVYVNPAFSAVRMEAAPHLDTLLYRGLNIVFSKQPAVRPTIFRRNILMYPGSLYSTEDVRLTYNRLMRLSYFRSASILFTPPDSLRSGVSAVASPATLNGPPQRYLDCTIQCTPALRHSYKIDLEGSTTSSFSSLTTSIGYLNRNLFRGAELFDISLSGGLEFMYGGNKKRSFEIGAATSLTVPRFLFPFEVNPYNRLANPRTRFDLSVSRQRRPYYDRVLSSAALGYSWGDRRGYFNFTVRPIDLNLIKMNSIDSTFEATLQQGNPYLADSYISQLIAGISGSIQYSSRESLGNRSVFTVRFSAETNGNLLRGLSYLGLMRDATGAFKIFGIPYSQYALFSLAFSHRIATSTNTSFVYRLWGGYGKAYGNSTAIPNDRLFYAGGSNSMRGWQARTLGPGSSPIIDSPYPVQRGDMKLEANAEFRFPVAGFLKGAIFTDVGNVWQAGRGNYDPSAIFHISSFYKQLGFDTGIGARLDFNFFLLRLDWGLQLHNPNRPTGERWIQSFTFSQTALTFGVGYPF